MNERIKFHLPETVTGRASTFFSYARRLKEWSGNNKLDTAGWGLEIAAIPNIALGFIRGGLVLGASEMITSLAMLCSADFILRKSQAEKKWGLVDGSLAVLGAVGLHSGIPELFVPSLIVGSFPTLAHLLVHLDASQENRV